MKMSHLFVTGNSRGKRQLLPGTLGSRIYKVTQPEVELSTPSAFRQFFHSASRPDALPVSPPPRLVCSSHILNLGPVKGLARPLVSFLWLYHWSCVSCHAAISWYPPNLSLKTLHCPLLAPGLVFTSRCQLEISTKCQISLSNPT